MNDMPFIVYQDIAIMSIFDLEYITCNGVPSETLNEALTSQTVFKGFLLSKFLHKIVVETGASFFSDLMAGFAILDNLDDPSQVIMTVVVSDRTFYLIRSQI